MKVVLSEVDPLLEGTELFTDSEGETPFVIATVAKPVAPKNK